MVAALACGLAMCLVMLLGASMTIFRVMKHCHMLELQLELQASRVVKAFVAEQEDDDEATTHHSMIVEVWTDTQLQESLRRTYGKNAQVAYDICREQCVVRAHES